MCNFQLVASGDLKLQFSISVFTLGKRTSQWAGQKVDSIRFSSPDMIRKRLPKSVTVSLITICIISAIVVKYYSWETVKEEAFAIGTEQGILRGKNLIENKQGESHREEKHEETKR